MTNRIRSVSSLVLLLIATCSAAFGAEANFTYDLNVGGTPPAQYFTVYSLLSSQLSGLSARPSAWWITATLSSTTTPTTLRIGVTPSELSRGTYSGYVDVSNSFARTTFYVNLTVTASAPTLTSYPSSLTFNATQGSPLPPGQTLDLTGNGLINLYPSSDVPAWLTVSMSPTGLGPFEAIARVSVNSYGATLAAGTYATTLQFTSRSVNGAGYANGVINVSVRLQVTAPSPTLRTSTSSLAFQGVVGGTPTPAQRIEITSSGSAVSAGLTVVGSWISPSVVSGTTPFNIDIKANPGTLPSGTYRGQVIVSSSSIAYGSSAVTIDVALSVGLNERPYITSVVNSATFKPNLGPGTWVSIVGQNLAAGTTQATTATLPMTLGGVSVQLRGVGAVFNLPIHYASPTQVNAFIPHETGPAYLINPAAELLLSTSFGSATIPVTIQTLSPALFAYGTERFAAAVHPDGMIVGVIPGTRPAPPGSVVSLYGTGFGQTSPQINNVNGLVPALPLQANVVVVIDDQPVPVLWAGMVGVGLYQFNIVVPSVPTGNHKVAVQITGMQTDMVLLPIQ